jgi:tetratricopeptide (TPR) repeat protein
LNTLAERAAAVVLVMSLTFAAAACLSPRAVEADSRFLNTAPDVEFVGDASCATCHAEIAESYASHGMAQSFYRLTDSTAVEDWSGVAVTHAATGFTYTARRDGNRFVQEETRTDPDGTVSHRLVRTMDFVVGSGSAARTYLSQENGRLYELPLTWYTESAGPERDSTAGPAGRAASERGGHWALSPGYDEFNNRFNRTIPERCMACHNGPSEPVPFTDGKFATLASGIGCEQCHGPGALHVEARLENPEAPDSVDVTIVNPEHLDLDLRLDVCQQCHLAGEVSVLRDGETATSYRPSRPLSAHRAVFALTEQDPNRVNVISHADRMKASACFIESGAMDCVTCHNPHEGFRDKGPEVFNATCETCHEPAALQAAMPTPETRAQHAASANCFSCHMPKVRAEDAPHASFTDHKIRVVRDDQITGVTASGGELTPYFEGDGEGSVTEAMAYVVYGRQNGGPEALRRGVALLDAALADNPGAGEAQFLLGFARLAMGQPSEAIAPLRAAVAAGENPERLNTLAQALEAAGQGGSEPLYRRALAIQPAEASIRVNLGRLLESQGRLAEAVAEYRAAAAEEPWLQQAHTLLGGALAKSGAVPDAIAALREAVTLDPDQGDALTNLGALLAQSGDVPQAGRLFARAAAADPRNANARANYALFLINSNRPAEALAEAQAALAVNPQQATAQQVLGALQGAMQ